MNGISNFVVDQSMKIQFNFLYFFLKQVLIPSGIGALIEMWKVTKAFRVKLVKPEGSWFYRPSLGPKQSQAEEMTGAYDSESLKYLSYLLYPLCIGKIITLQIGCQSFNWVAFIQLRIFMVFQVTLSKLYFRVVFKPNLSLIIQF